MSASAWKWIGAVAAVLVVLILITLAASGTGDPASGLFGGTKLGPEARKAQALVESVKDHHQAGSIIDAGVAKSVACGAAARNAFDPSTGKNRYWFYRWPEGTIECFNTGGYHRVTGEALSPLGVDQIKVIIGDDKKYPADTDLWAPPVRVAAPTAHQHRPAAPAAPTATVPDLSEGPCCPK